MGGGGGEFEGVLGGGGSKFGEGTSSPAVESPCVCTGAHSEQIEISTWSTSHLLHSVALSVPVPHLVGL